MSLKKYRDLAKLTRSELADSCGVSISQISHLENGIRKLDKVSIDVCRAIVNKFISSGVKCTLDDVFPPAKVKKISQNPKRGIQKSSQQSKAASESEAA